MAYVVHHFDLDLSLIGLHGESEDFGRGCLHVLTVFVSHGTHREATIFCIVLIIIIYQIVTTPIQMRRLMTAIRI